LFYGIFHPQVIFNFLFGIVTEIAEFHKRCGGPLKNFNDSEYFREIKKHVFLSKSSFFHSGFGNIHPWEAQVMAELVHFFKPKTLFEIGTFNGFSTLHLAQNSPEDAVIYTLDLPQDKKEILLKHDPFKAYRDVYTMKMNSRRLFHDREEAKKITELFDDTLHFNFFPYYGKMDFVFIDTSHSYQYVKSDTVNAFKMLRPGGMILWHDFDFIHPSVYLLVKEVARQKTVYFIPRTRWALYIHDEENQKRPLNLD